MRRIAVLAIILVSFGISIPLAKAIERIISYDVTVHVNAGAGLTVVETIVYDFGNEVRHGIYRTIPYVYKARGGNYKLDIYDIKVKDAIARTYDYHITKRGRKIEIKIGNPAALVTGVQSYSITYSVANAFNYFDSHDEIYWNVIGNDWSVPIEKASVRVYLPQRIPEDRLQYECFTGILRSVQTCDSMERFRDTAGTVAVLAAHDEDLFPGYGLTTVIGLPKGIVYEPTVSEKLLGRIADNAILALPLFIALFFLYLWYIRGRDPKGRGNIIARYSPPDEMTPAQVGTIIDETVNNYDISADIIHLAVNGYLKIIRVEEKKVLTTSIDYILEKQKDSRHLYEAYQQQLFDALFADSQVEILDGREVVRVRISNLRSTFHKQYRTAQKSIYRDLVAKGYFVKNPHTVRTTYALVGLIVALPGGIIGFAASSILTAVSIIISGFIIFMFSFIMPRKTKKGALAREHILGLQLYIEVAEKKRIEYHNAPEKNPQLFDRLLPYAMVMRAEKAWAKQFESMYTLKPSWYESSDTDTINVLAFVNSIHYFSQVSARALSTTTSTAAAGGSGFRGGFSGGGFGGGGGSSW